MLKIRYLVAALLLVLAIAVGAGLARAGVIEVEGEMRLHIRPVPSAVIKAGPVDGPYASGPFFFFEPATVEFLTYAANDPNGGDLTFEWDFTYDTVVFNVDATGPGPFTYEYPDGPLDELVALRLTSSTGAVGYVIDRLIISNLPPTASLDGPYSGFRNDVITFTATATDASATDTAAGLHFAWDFDYEGNAFTTDASGIGLNSVSHAYDTPGEHTVAVRVTDKDGGGVMVTAPVTISINTTQVSLAANHDSYIKEDSGGTNYGGSSTMNVKTDGGGRVRRSLVSFDLSTLPAGANILAATLKLYASSVPATERTHQAYRITESWSESTVKWSNQPSVFSAPINFSYTPATPAWVSWDVTVDVQDAVDGAITFNGWMLEDLNETESPAQTVTYVTKEATDASLHPVLEVVYETP